jgi:hypothetical protein
MDMDCGRDPSPNRMNTLSGKSKEFTVDAEQHDAATPLDPSSSSIQYSQIFNLQSEIPNSYDLDINKGIDTKNDGFYTGGKTFVSGPMDC